ncbi:hypothetical protein SAMN05421541_107102 [Actinoplanes philippinensis]|uniref:Uncharacterized protein n=1 Tax=Actinoplanes philippinensis TaxID=35752 RepID=A0A1I2GSF2_9ACTN|nr:hypothetical protein [Actinoplanes philippinensis]SFF19979.1 hypothetical protein SAMN05421541_107102 [Actinoplanes philippinensis]
MIQALDQPVHGVLVRNHRQSPHQGLFEVGVRRGVVPPQQHRAGGRTGAVEQRGDRPCRVGQEIPGAVPAEYGHRVRVLRRHQQRCAEVLVTGVGLDGGLGQPVVAGRHEHRGGGPAVEMLVPEFPEHVGHGVEVGFRQIGQRLAHPEQNRPQGAGVLPVLPGAQTPYVQRGLARGGVPALGDVQREELHRGLGGEDRAAFGDPQVGERRRLITVLPGRDESRRRDRSSTGRGCGSPLAEPPQAARAQVAGRPGGVQDSSDRALGSPGDARRLGRVVPGGERAGPAPAPASPPEIRPFRRKHPPYRTTFRPRASSHREPDERT